MCQLPAKRMTAITTNFGIVQRLRFDYILTTSLAREGQNVRFYKPPSMFCSRLRIRRHHTVFAVDSSASVAVEPNHLTKINFSMSRSSKAASFATCIGLYWTCKVLLGGRGGALKVLCATVQVSEGRLCPVSACRR